MVTKHSVRAPNGHQMAERKSTRYPGVYTYESSLRRHNGRPDIAFCIDYRDSEGKRQRKTIGWASSGMTAAKAHQIRIQIISGKEQAPWQQESVQRDPTFGSAWERYYHDWMLAQNKNARSDLALIRGHLQIFTTLRLSEITPYRIDLLMADMHAQGLAAQSISLAVGLIRRVMRRMRIWGLYDGPDPFVSIKMPRPNNRRMRYLEPEEARMLLQELQRRSEQTWMMALISLHCGLRFGEIAALTYGDVNFADGTLYIRESKNGRARHAVMTDEVRMALHNLPLRPSTELLFPSRSGGRKKSPSDCFARAVDACGLNDTGRQIALPDGTTTPERKRDARERGVFHTLRHTYASWLAMAGERELALADLLGHSTTAMTRRYSHLMEAARRGTAQKIGQIFHSDSDATGQDT